MDKRGGGGWIKDNKSMNLVDSVLHGIKLIRESSL